MKWALYASGFREDRGEHTGTKSNAHRVRDLYQSSDCCVIYVEWKNDPKGYAQSIASQWEAGDVLTVMGYSWGAGNWVKKFLWALYKANPSIKVSHVLLVDPVVRSPWPWMRWLAVSPWGTIKLPDNVKLICGVRQELNEPNCSKIEVGGISGIEEVFEVLPYEHTKIDNAKEVTDRVLEIARRYLA